MPWWFWGHLLVLVSLNLWFCDNCLERWRIKGQSLGYLQDEELKCLIREQGLSLGICNHRLALKQYKLRLQFILPECSTKPQAEKLTNTHPLWRAQHQPRPSGFPEEQKFTIQNYKTPQKPSRGRVRKTNSKIRHPRTRWWNLEAEYKISIWVKKLNKRYQSKEQNVIKKRSWQVWKSRPSK